ncbi:MAG: sigma-70 family RNA polymerase sigma factor [Candidatus Krumholzibacteria bacterium]|nr:sigma-70 family RNA polymerase sigma factor [Candidatus Krumholzibacteria bacterium]
MDLKKRMRDGRHGLWLRLARRGNEDAFRRLYGELYDPVAGYIAARTNNVHDAEDLTSAVFQKFLERLDRFEADKGSVMTWILAMARNAVIDHHRRLDAHGSARKGPVPVEELAEVLAADQGDPLGSLVRDEDLRQVRQLLCREPDDVREMFALRFGQGLRVREVAAVMNLGEAAVKQRFARTLRKIRQELLAEEPERKGGPECMIAD